MRTSHGDHGWSLLGWEIVVLRERVVLFFGGGESVRGVHICAVCHVEVFAFDFFVFDASVVRVGVECVGALEGTGIHWVVVWEVRRLWEVWCWGCVERVYFFVAFESSGVVGVDVRFWGHVGADFFGFGSPLFVAVLVVVVIVDVGVRRGHVHRVDLLADASDVVVHHGWCSRRARGRFRCVFPTAASLLRHLPAVKLQRTRPVLPHPWPLPTPTPHLARFQMLPLSVKNPLWTSFHIRT